jgi:TRAP transporter TAXI family solute receptor
MRVSIAALLVAASIALCASPGGAQQKRTGPAPSQEAQRHKANENVLVLMAGGLGGPYLHLAHDISVAVNDGDNLRVLPVGTGGALGNVRDVLMLRNVDLGITTVQILNELKATGEYGNIHQRIAYIAPLSVDTFHVLVRSGINSIEDLKGKKASFNFKGSGTERFGPKVLKTLGVTLTETTMAPADAVEALRNGTLDAAVCSCPVPVPGFAAAKSEWGLKFLDVPYLPAMEDEYVPANLTNMQYPNVVGPDGKVQTIATSTILITYNWPPGSERYQRIKKFVDAFFSNADKLRQPPRHPIWKDVNIAASIRGWNRFPAAQQWLDRQAAEASAKAKAAPIVIDTAKARAQAAKAAPHDAAEQERLFKEFLEWSRKRPKR